MADIIAFPERDWREGVRMSRLINHHGFDAADAQFGTPEDWAWSAVVYLKAALAPSQFGTFGGSVEVSTAAIGAVLIYVEDLAGRLGIIPAPDGAA